MASFVPEWAQGELDDAREEVRGILETLEAPMEAP